MRAAFCSAQLMILRHVWQPLGVQTLGRADNIKDFVRKGAHSFWTEITLSSGGEGRDHVVRRTVTVRTERDADGQRRERHESKWKINGAWMSCLTAPCVHAADTQGFLGRRLGGNGLDCLFSVSTGCCGFNFE